MADLVILVPSSDVVDDVLDAAETTGKFITSLYDRVTERYAGRGADPAAQELFKILLKLEVRLQAARDAVTAAQAAGWPPGSAQRYVDALWEIRNVAQGGQSVLSAFGVHPKYAGQKVSRFSYRGEWVDLDAVWTLPHEIAEGSSVTFDDGSPSLLQKTNIAPKVPAPPPPPPRPPVGPSRLKGNDSGFFPSNHGAPFGFSSGPVGVTWDPGPFTRLDGRPDSPQARDRAAIAALQGGGTGHGDEFFFGLGGGGSIQSKLGGPGGPGGGRGPGMGEFASLTRGPRDTNRYAHGKKPGPMGPNPASGKSTGGTKTGQTARGPNPSGMASANPPASRSTDKDQGFAKTGPVDRGPSSGPTVVQGTTGGAGPSTITVQAPPKAGTVKDPGTLQINDEEVDTGDPYVEDATDDPKKGGGGSMPNPEDSGGGGEGPRSRRVRLEGPNPENTGKNARNELRVPARLRFASQPNPGYRALGSGSEGDPMALAADRPFDRTFLYRLPGARNYGGPGDGGGYRPGDDGSGTGGGVGGPRAYGGSSRSSLAGPRSYDAYPDPESTGGGGPRGRYNERPNPEDTGSPHGPSARNRNAIGPWSASKNRMI